MVDGGETTHHSVGDGPNQTVGAERRRGRPTKTAAAGLSHTILEIAFRQFLEAGYSATSMDSVAAEARTSKRTLYDRFPSKQRLFEAALHHQILFNYDALRVLETQTGPIAEVLPQIAVWLRTNTFAPRTISLFRLLAAEGHRHPELADYSESRVLRPIIVALTNVFARACERGEVRDMPPEFLANQFVQAICGGDIRASIYGVPKTDGADAIALRTQYAVDLFLRGAAPAT
ncbi:transcriptional regulator, TetR family [Aureimonas phyllosphaerae]|nr:transcriptional regulator, TetR family [Aureimonas phyllosphaerae]